MFKTRIVCARWLMVDDRFKMGGSMYRITKFDINRQLGRVEIEAYNIAAAEESTLFASFPTNVRIKIYNLA